MAALGGTIEVNLLEEAEFEVGETFTLLTASSILDEFSNVLLPTLLGESVFALDYTDTDVTLTALADRGAETAWRRQS